MPTYTAPHRAPSRLKHRSRRAAIRFTIVSLLFVSLLAVSKATIHAAPANNPIFATFDYVQNAISTALAPIQSAIANLESQQANQAAQISSLQNSTGKNLKVLNANGNELGLLVGHGPTDTVYSSALSKYIAISDNDYAASTAFSFNSNFASTDSNGIGNEISQLFYKSADCTGNPFTDTSNSYSRYANDVMSFGNSGEYFIFHLPASPQTFTPGSSREWFTEFNRLSPCFSGGPSNVQFSQLYPVSLPFPLPVAQPLQFKYQ